MLAEGIIEKSTSPYSNPLVVVTKKDLSIRLCLDARQVNKIIVPDRESPEPVSEILQRFNGTKYITTLDLTAGYWQIELEEEFRQYVEFLYNRRNYQFCRFGLNVSVSIFIKCLDYVLGREILEFTTVYVDDKVITSPDINTHCERLDRVLSRLHEYGITVKFKKSEFLKEQVNFLGHIISAKGISTDPKNCLLYTSRCV